MPPGCLPHSGPWSTPPSAASTSQSTTLIRAHPSRRAGRDHSSRPLPLPPPDDFQPASALLPVGCRLIIRGPASANPSLGHCGDIINRRQRRPLLPRDPNRQPESYVLLLKRPLHIRLCKRQSHTRPKLSMFFLQGNVQGNAPHYSDPVKAVFMPLQSSGKG